MTAVDFSVREASWSKEKAALREIRTRVFVQEQGVPASLEWDDADQSATHFIAETQNGAAIGTARLLATGQIGRMAVLENFRTHGVGKQLLGYAIETAKGRGLASVFLHAQVRVREFYQRSGFIAEGETYMEAGIPHINMRKHL